MKSGSLVEMAAHLATRPSPIFTDPVGSTTMPPYVFIESIPKTGETPGVRHVTRTC